MLMTISMAPSRKALLFALISKLAWISKCWWSTDTRLTKNVLISLNESLGLKSIGAPKVNTKAAEY